MLVDGVVLAGGSAGKGDRLGVGNEALVPVAGRPMVAWVLQALRHSGCLGRLVLVGPEELAGLAEEEKVTLVPSGRTAVESALKGAEALPGAEWILLVTADIPMLTPEAVRDFLERCRKIPADLYYPIVTRRDSETAYPGVKRTYVPLKEGTFTGGNMALLRAGALPTCALRGQKLVALRKSPLALGCQIGPFFILKFVLRRLSLAEVERRFSELLGVRGVAVITPYPEIGVDVDKPDDLELARRVLSAKAASDPLPGPIGSS
ncbi:NTP transferase domain-containing protein [Moorellaceae bacterium AZ2]